MTHLLESAPGPVAVSALASFLLANVLVATSTLHGRFTMDAPGAIQKFHAQPTPRIGGLGIYLALLITYRLLHDAQTRTMLAVLLLAGIPALTFGLMEDVTKRISVIARLLATMASGLAACWLTGVSLTQLNVPGLDWLLRMAPFALVFTAFCVAGVANAFNIIDGFHGLASGTALIGLLAMAAIAAMVGDTTLAWTACIIAAAVAGFWLVNFPWGRLFLGDGGAYFTGFVLAWLAVLLPARNAEVSPWASLMVCAYPIIEVLYSIARRRRKRQSPGQADRRHLHSLVATQFVQPRFKRLHPTLQNAAVSVIMWSCAAVPALAAIVFYRHTDILAGCALVSALAYHLIYRRVSRQ